MVRYLFFAIALMVTQLTFGQKEPVYKSERRQANEKEQEIHDRSEDCAKHTTRSSFAERIKNYPFNTASQIQLVSFKKHYDTLNGVIIGDGEYSLPRKGDTICHSKLYEVKNLTYSQVDKLTDLLYNYGYRSQMKNTNLTYIDVSLLCYNPRNAILFLDTTGKVFEFVEICFECDKAKESSSRINLGVMCNQKLELLKRFFETTGIEHGVTSGVIHDN